MNFRRLANSIVTRIVLLGLAVVLAGAATRYFFLADFLRQDMGAVVALQQQALAGYVARDIDLRIQARQTQLQQTAKLLPLASLHDPAALRLWLSQREHLLALFSEGLIVVDMVGTALADYPPRPERIDIDYGEHDDVRTALGGAIGIGRPTIDNVTGRYVLPLAAPIADVSGRVRAALVGVIAIGAPDFISFPAQSRIGKDGGFQLVSPRDRLVIAATNGSLTLQATPAAGVDLLFDRAMAGYRGSGTTVNAQGIEETAAIASVPSTGWFVTAGMANSDGLTSLGRLTRYVVINSALVAVIFFMVATILLMSIFRPLFRAADYADRMTRGELALEPLPVERADEVGHLTEAFNRLLAKLQTTQSELARMAHHDGLTGLPNSTLLNDRIAQALARAQRNDKCVGVLYLDLDCFKPVNDELGHEAGDAALVEMARRLAVAVRESDTVARIGGDEFIIVMADLEPTGDLAKVAVSTVASKCLHAVKTPILLQGQTRYLGVSVGIAIGNGQSTADSLRKAADDAMYQAKKAGRDRYVIHGESASGNQAVPGPCNWPEIPALPPGDPAVRISV